MYEELVKVLQGSTDQLLTLEARLHRWCTVVVVFLDDEVPVTVLLLLLSLSLEGGISSTGSVTGTGCFFLARQTKCRA